MDVKRELIDKQFDRYVLAANGPTVHEASLPTGVLSPLDTTDTLRKAQWDARAHYNAMVADPFRSHALSRSVAYALSKENELLQIVFNQSGEAHVTGLYRFPMVTTRQENATLQVLTSGVVVYGDGNGQVVCITTDHPEEINSTWKLLSSSSPLGITPVLVLGSSKYEEEGCSHLVSVLSQVLESHDKDEVFRLTLLDIEQHPHEVVHETVYDIGTVSKLPNYVSFAHDQLVMLLEGPYHLEMTSKSGLESPQTSTDESINVTSPHKRSHIDSELGMDLNELLSKLPRAGIGFQGDVSEAKHADELAMDFNRPLSDRFQPSSTPYSSMEGTHGPNDQQVPTQRDSAAQNVEIPTPDTILGGFEECDDFDPNATASLVLLDMKKHQVMQQLEVNCRKFHFLCESSRLATPSAGMFDRKLLFQYDVHGLVFDVSVSNEKLTLEHMETLPAFGYVQASKQDKRIMTFHPETLVASIAEFERRAFVYLQNGSEEEVEQHVRGQYVVEIGEHSIVGQCMPTRDRLIVLAPDNVFCFHV